MTIAPSYYEAIMQGNMVFNRAPSPIGDKRNLSPNFVPSDYDVICGKGKSCFNHPGNKSFRKLVGLYLDGYAEATTKLEKSAIVSSIIQTVRTQNPGGGFVKLDTPSGVWQEVGDHLAREKVGQTIRDALHSQYRSSTKAKKIRRQAEQAIASDTMTMISNMHCQISSKIDDLQSKITNTQTDRQLSDMFTQANLEILNELNQLNQFQSASVPEQTTMAQTMPRPSTLIPAVTLGLPTQELRFSTMSSSSLRIFPIGPQHHGSLPQLTTMFRTQARIGQEDDDVKTSAV